ncbi:MOSC domain-containing protein [Demequina sp. SYSU T00039]|uniref:MOSC domain-containing protein n=1 Tax=Demequina lignilytica TaxID=3051663 RepID=A0AAW7M8G3_9MICO|nr:MULTISPECIES: MOSC domain-containing protein [unclassified Demequina]MDN4477866.1 MOSC domain-containing protein [Demequina sp. SYSU T00039-1]MDN4487775.1 MOSC domain-containing protein [Demequina sp. SYSU T00039]MDN4490842.1 MOSC domain-containing protein [Demequina sp. SYSU T00068]
MRIVSLHRFPVKAMGGEDIDAVRVDGRGLAHDRAFAVVDADGMFAAGKRGSRWRPHEAIFGFAATARDDAVVVLRGDAAWEAGSPGLDAELSAATGEPMRVVAETPGETDFFDAKPVSIVGTATLDWCRAELGADADPRRLRVNVVVETDEPFVEESWIGSRIGLGDVALDVVKRNTRCRVIDQAQNGATERTRWLKPLGDRRDGCVAVYATVATPGIVRVGDPVAPLTA